MKHPLLQDLKRNRTKWLMLLPAAIAVILMCYIPMTGIVLAFKEFNYHDGIFGSPWACLSNFTYFFKSGKAWSVTRNTVLYNLAFLSINTILQVSCAIFLSELRRKNFKRITQSIMFFPYFISWVVVGAFVYNLFNYEFGAVNTFLRQIGLEQLDVYSNPKAWIPILICASLFKNLGYGTVMYLASVINIDPQLYEAADLDGATTWQRIWHITLPSIRPTMIIMILLSIGTIMKGDFQMFWQVTGNNPMTLEITDVIDTYVTRSLMYMQEFGMTSAAGLYQSIVSFFLILFANWAVKKGDPELCTLLKHCPEKAALYAKQACVKAQTGAPSIPLAMC